MDGNGYNREFWQMLDRIVGASELVIDRPKGTRHPKYPSIVYPVDYGYLKGTSSMDGGGIDVWRGTGVNAMITGVMVTVDRVKNDSEIKILLSCTGEEMETVYRFHNETDYMKGLLITNSFGRTDDA